MKFEQLAICWFCRDSVRQSLGLLARILDHDPASAAIPDKGAHGLAPHPREGQASGELWVAHRYRCR